MPTKEKTRIAFSGAVSEKSPSTDVVVPMVVPFTLTETPGIGERSSSEVTFPVMRFVWANNDAAPMHKASTIKRIFFIDKNLY